MNFAFSKKSISKFGNSPEMDFDGIFIFCFFMQIYNRKIAWSCDKFKWKNAKKLTSGSFWCTSWQRSAIKF